jgi:DNA-binding MurR/RpiR family transcriptional regulator
MTVDESKDDLGAKRPLPNGVIPRLENSRRHLAPIAQRIVDFIIAHPQEVIGMSVTDLAARLDVSVGSIVRVCQQIDLAGFQELKLGLARELVAPAKFIHEDVTEQDDAAAVLEKVIQSDIRALVDTLKVIDPAALQRAAALIVAAERVECYGIGSSAPIAVDIYYRLLRIGINCVAVVDSHIQAVSAALTHSRVVVVTISHSGSTRETVDAMRLAKQAGASTICITNYGKSPIQEYTDVVLYTAATETLFRTEAMTSRIAQLSVADALLVCVALARFNESLRTINRTAEVLSIKRY